MNRNDFLQKLKELLSNIPENERDEAISFYEDYFDEAGSDNEEKVIKDLESPEKVAETILAGLSEKELETGEVPLDEAINKYTEAMKLAKECSDKLNTAVEKVNKVLKENGTLEEFNVEN